VAEEKAAKTHRGWGEGGKVEVMEKKT